MRQCFLSPLKSGCLSKPPKSFCGLSWHIAITIFLVLAITVGVFFAVCLKNQTESLSKIMEKIDTARKKNDQEYASLANKMENITNEIARFEKDLEAKFTIDAPKVDPYKGIECYYQNYSRLYQGTKNTTSSGKTCIAWSLWSFPEADYQFPPFMRGVSLTESRNYCRVPLRFQRSKPWCPTGTDSPATQWDYCDVKVCTDAPPVPDIDFNKDQVKEIAELGNMWRMAAPSSDMLPMVWDERLQESARLASASCCQCGKLGHPPLSWFNQKTGLPWQALDNGAGYGYTYVPIVPAFRGNGGFPLKRFYHEKPNYCIINNFPAPGHSFWDTGHYTVMMNSGWTNFGCGRHYCNNTEYRATVTYCHFGGYGWGGHKLAGVPHDDSGRPFRLAIDKRRGISLNGKNLAEYKANANSQARIPLHTYKIQYDFDCPDDDEELRVGDWNW